MERQTTWGQVRNAECRNRNRRRTASTIVLNPPSIFYSALRISHSELASIHPRYPQLALAFAAARRGGELIGRPEGRLGSGGSSGRRRSGAKSRRCSPGNAARGHHDDG